MTQYHERLKRSKHFSRQERNKKHDSRRRAVDARHGSRVYPHHGAFPAQTGTDYTGRDADNANFQYARLVRDDGSAGCRWATNHFFPQLPAVPETSAAGSLKTVAVPEVVPEKEEVYTVETNRIIAQISNAGGDIVSLKLKDHKDKTGTWKCSCLAKRYERPFCGLWES